MLAIIPARGGSKKIPRKNIRFLAGKPLIAYSIKNGINSKYIKKLVVSTDDEEIAHIAHKLGASIVMRPNYLATDKITIDPVIEHTVSKLDERGEHFDSVITLQPTSPLLTVQTIDKAINFFMKNPKIDTLLSVVDERHLSWTKKNGKFVPNYKERLNRQYLPPNYIETGGFVITRSEHITSSSRFGKKIHLFEIPKDQSIDIDNEMDWWIAEKLLTKKLILIRVDGYREIGLGHIYRMLSIANRLIDHEVVFVSKEEYLLGIDLIRKNNYNLETYSTNEELKSIICKYSPDIIINDILDTEEEYIKYLRRKGIFTVNFEDLGNGAKLADLVINALYEEKYPLKNHYWGKEFYCLREEFYFTNEKKISKDVREILISFGGTDKNNYSRRILDIIYEMNLVSEITIILGLGYKNKEDLIKFANSINLNVNIKQNIKNISKYMEKTDIAITSAGRTIYELASIGIPTIVLCQNERELHHTFAHPQNGMINLGLGYTLTDLELKEAIKELIDNYEMRKRCNKLMLKYNLKNGIKNVVELIFRSYERSKA